LRNIGLAMEKEPKTKKKEKVKVVYLPDDGRTLYSMDGLADMKGVGTKNKKEENPVGLSRKEKWIAIKAAYATYLPIFLAVLCCFGVVAVLMYLWLS